jgi:hypothetical protein
MRPPIHDLFRERNRRNGATGEKVRKDRGYEVAIADAGLRRLSDDRRRDHEAHSVFKPFVQRPANLDVDFASIVRGVLEGRVLYANIIFLLLSTGDAQALGR